MFILAGDEWRKGKRESQIESRNMLVKNKVEMTL